MRDHARSLDLSPRRQRLQRWLVVTLIGAAILAVVSDALVPTSPVAPDRTGTGVLGTIAAFLDAMPSMPLLLLCGAIVGVPLVLLHELGHALVAVARGSNDVRVTVGTNVPLGGRRLAGVDVEVNALSNPGQMNGLAVWDARNATRADVVLVALAGPVASLAGFLLTAWALAFVGPGLIHDLLWVGTAGGAAGVLNLVPLTLTESDGRTLRTDGAIIRDALRPVRIQRPYATAASPTSAQPNVTPTLGHEPLRGRGGAPIGVEPLPRHGDADPADDGLSRRARALQRHSWRSVPPPPPKR